MHRGRLVAGFGRLGGAIEASSTRLQSEPPFVGVAPPSRFGYGYAQAVIPADWLRHPLNSNVGRLRKSQGVRKLKAREAASQRTLAGQMAGWLEHEARLTGGMKIPTCACQGRLSLARLPDQNHKMKVRLVPMSAPMRQSGLSATAASKQPGLLASAAPCRPTRHSSGLASPSAEFQR